MNRDELVKIVEKIMKVDGTEEEIFYLVQIFVKNVPDPEAKRFIFSPKYPDLTPEEVVDRALSYKPIIL